MGKTTKPEPIDEAPTEPKPKPSASSLVRALAISSEYADELVAVGHERLADEIAAEFDKIASEFENKETISQFSVAATELGYLVMVLTNRGRLMRLDEKGEWLQLPGLTNG